MKLDPSCVHFLSKDDIRILTAIELGMRNHELVPIPLILSISKLRKSGVSKLLANLARNRLIAYDQSHFESFRLSYKGYDCLALHALICRGCISSVEKQIGVGKESDVYSAITPDGAIIVLKFHRLGRTSFRAVRKKRDYLKHRVRAINWLYMNRLSAKREFEYMTILHNKGFPTPIPIDWNRHIVVMSAVIGDPLCRIRPNSINCDISTIFAKSVQILYRLTKIGLIHCDFNEFNLILSSDASVLTLIDFPQVVSIKHLNAPQHFSHDLLCLIKFFSSKMGVDDADLACAMIDVGYPVNVTRSSIKLAHDDVINEDEGDIHLEQFLSEIVNESDEKVDVDDEKDGGSAIVDYYHSSKSDDDGGEKVNDEEEDDEDGGNDDDDDDDENQIDVEVDESEIVDENNDADDDDSHVTEGMNELLVK